MKHQHSVLIVEDEQLILAMLEDIISERDLEIVTAMDGQSGLALYFEQKHDIVITDIRMPGMDGLEMIKRIKEKNKKVKILIISAFSDTKYVLEAIDLGVQGFLVKPIDKDRLLEQIDELLHQIMLEEKVKEEEEKFIVLSSAARDAIIIMDSKGMVTFWNQGAESIFQYSKDEIMGKDLHALIVPDYYHEDYSRVMHEFAKTGDGKFVGKTVELKGLRRDGTEFDAELSLTSIKLRNEWNAVGILRDITDRLKAEEELIRAYKKMDILAHTDDLTELSNRRDVMEKIHYEMIRFQRNKVPFSIAIGDLDGFKRINDRYGHEAGDETLKQIASIMTNSVRKQDVVSRWGGEEFMLLFPKTDLKGAKVISEKIRKQIERNEFFYEYEDQIFHITITFGIATFDDNMDMDTCIRLADEALYRGKRSGKNCVILSTNEKGKK